MHIDQPLQYSELINGTRITFHGATIDQITSDVIRIREKNGKESPEWNIVYNNIKPKIQGTVQIDGPNSNKFKKRSRSGKGRELRRNVSLRDAARAANALIKIVKGDFVPEEEYIRRLEICSGCTVDKGGHRKKNSDCMSCGGAGSAARMAMEVKKSTGQGYELNNTIGMEYCDFCGCSFSLLLVTKVEYYKQESELENHTRPRWCWLRKDSDNYVG